MYSHILIPVAYEPGYDIEREVEVARRLLAPKGRVTMVHAMDPVPFYAIDYMPPEVRDELIAAIHNDMRAKAEGFETVETAVVEGDSRHVIVDKAEAVGADCIVLSAHRKDTALFGSTASWVARHAPCAVHLIR